MILTVPNMTVKLSFRNFIPNPILEDIKGPHLKASQNNVSAALSARIRSEEKMHSRTTCHVTKQMVIGPVRNVAIRPIVKSI